MSSMRAHATRRKAAVRRNRAVPAVVTLQSCGVRTPSSRIASRRRPDASGSSCKSMGKVCVALDRHRSGANYGVMRKLILPTVALILTGCGVQSIPTAHNEVEAAWAEVQNQYKRRADLVPNLVNTVKGYA